MTRAAKRSWPQPTSVRPHTNMYIHPSAAEKKEGKDREIHIPANRADRQGSFDLSTAFARVPPSQGRRGGGAAAAARLCQKPNQAFIIRHARSHSSPTWNKLGPMEMGLACLSRINTNLLLIMALIKSRQKNMLSHSHVAGHACLRLPGARRLWSVVMRPWAGASLVRVPIR